MTVPNITLNDGRTIPQLGFGVFQIDPSETKAATLAALEVGYRHIDTAEMYGNEKEVGEAIAESGIDRSEIFVTSKLNNGFHDPQLAAENGKKSADLLGGYTDLFLIHWPLPTVSDFVPTWKALEEALPRRYGAFDRRQQLPGAPPQPPRCRDDGHPGRQPDRGAPVPRAGRGSAPTVASTASRPRPGPRSRRASSSTTRPSSASPEPRARPRHRSSSAGTSSVATSSSRSRSPAPASRRTSRSSTSRLSDEDMTDITTLDKGHRTGPDPDTFDYVPA